MHTNTVDRLTTKAKLFRGFADRSRLSIVEILRGGASSVSKIVERTGLTQSNVSNHLACLLDCALVRREQKGRFVYYELSDQRVHDLLREAEDLLEDVAPGVEACERYQASGKRA